MLIWPDASKGFALPLALTTSVLLLLSSLSLQTLALHARLRTSQAAVTTARTDQQVLLLEHRLLASRRALASAPVADVDCRWEPEAVVGVLEGLPVDDHLSSSWSFDSSGDGLWLAVELTDLSALDAAIPFKRSQLLTPAGLGHCPREANDDQ